MSPTDWVPDPKWELPEEWDNPLPLGAGTPDTFPTDAITAPWLRAWISAEAEATQTPDDLAGVVALGVLAAACHGRVVVESRPGYREPVNIYAAVALESGNRKSAVFEDATDPIYTVEGELAAERHDEVAAHAAQRRVLERRLSDAETAAAKAEGIEAAVARDEVNNLAIELANYHVISSPRFVVDDITSEAMVGVLVEQDGIVSVLSAEGGIFDTMAGRYSQGIPNLDVFLKGHSGDQLRVDRRGRPAEIIARPCVTLTLAVQPDVLRSLAEKPGFRGRGLVARFLYSLPVSTVGHRRIAPAPVPEYVKDAYARCVSRLLRAAEATNESVVLALSADAGEEMVRFETAHEPRLAPVVGELAHMADWGSKLPGAVIRLAGLLHVAEHVDDGWDRPIEVETIRAAIALGRYFTSHALGVFDLMRADQEKEVAVKVLKWIRSHHLDRFTKRDAHRALQHVFPRADDLDAPLEMLEERLFIRRQADSHDGPGRHPSPTFVTNPRWREVLTHMTERGSDRDCVSSVSTIRDPGPVNPETNIPNGDSPNGGGQCWSDGTPVDDAPAEDNAADLPVEVLELLDAELDGLFDEEDAR